MEEVIDQVLATAKAKIQDKEFHSTKAITFDEYEAELSKSSPPLATDEEGITLCVYGLMGELGEVCEPLKKHFYHGMPIDIVHIQKEIGDVLWYLTRLNSYLESYSKTGITMGDVAAYNLEKLRKRYPNGFQKGGGIR